jgi:AcrR family transcriptional regulator
VDKQARMERVAEHIARLIVRHGLDAVTHSRVARGAEVSRPWLYKYVGRERQALVDFMARHFALQLAELDQRPRCDSAESWIDDTVEGLAVMVRHTQRAPWLLPLYFRYIGTDTPIGACIDEIESRYLARSALEIEQAGLVPAADARRCAELINAARWGIVHRHGLGGFDGDPELQHVRAQFRRWLQAIA